MIDEGSELVLLAAPGIRGLVLLVGLMYLWRLEDAAEELRGPQEADQAHMHPC